MKTAPPLIRGRTYGAIAQLGEHLPYKQRVGGSIPSLDTICGCSTTARAPAFQAGDAGSIPVTRSICRSGGIGRRGGLKSQ